MSDERYIYRSGFAKHLPSGRRTEGAEIAACGERCADDSMPRPHLPVCRNCLRWAKRDTYAKTKRGVCAVDECDRPIRIYGYCRTHASRYERTGTTEPRRKVIDQFWDRVDKRGPDECWEWQGSLAPQGYGRIGKLYAHRLSCEWAHGEPKPGQQVLHACDNRPCVNPAHLSWGTQVENMQDMVRKGRGRYGRNRSA